MPFIGRSSLSAEFFDTTSAMLLVEPEPQYLYALLAKLALGASSMGMPSSLGLPGRDGIGASGAPYSGDDGRLILDDAISTEAVTVVQEIGKAPGHTVRINRPVFTNTTYTQAAREIANGATISTTPIDVSSSQAAITLKRFGGPYDQTNSRVAPFGVDRFDASMPVHKLADVVGLHLKRDVDRTLDSFMIALADLGAAGTIRPRGFTADNDSTVAGDAPMDFNVISRTEKTLDEANIPYFGNGKRVMVLDPNQIQQLEEDGQFAKFAKEEKIANPVLAKAYYKSVAKFDIYKSNTLTQTANSSTVNIHTGHAFGPGMFGMGVGRLPEVVQSTADNFGEHALVMWLAYLALANLDSRFGALIKTS